MSLRFLTAGESHGEMLMGILEGLPSGIEIDIEYINKELRDRQTGYGRGKRMSIEKDRVKIVSGLYKGKTTGAPLGIVIENLDYKNWKDKFRFIDVPRPGHADFSGAIKYGTFNVAEILERASARETAIRTAIGAICKYILSQLEIEIFSFVFKIGSVEINTLPIKKEEKKKAKFQNDLKTIESKYKEMKSEIDKAMENGYTLGGGVEIIAENIPIGLGSHVHYDRRLDSQISHIMMSIPSVKAIEIGYGILSSSQKGIEVMDEIHFNEDKGYFRNTNLAGGIEGGITNGEDIIVRLYAKPIPTQMKPLDTIHLKNNEKAKAFKERADVCVVPAIGIIGENLLAFVILKAILEKFRRDNFINLKKDLNEWKKLTKNYPKNYENYY